MTVPSTTGSSKHRDGHEHRKPDKFLSGLRCSCPTVFVLAPVRSTESGTSSVSPEVVELVWLTDSYWNQVPVTVEGRGSGKSGSSGTCLAYGARASPRARTGASS